MLRLEWERWYEMIPIMKAEEAYDAYVGGVMVNPDWKYDREGVLRRWLDLINRKHRTRTVEVTESGDEFETARERDNVPGGLRRSARFVQRWLRSNMGGWGNVWHEDAAPMDITGAPPPESSDST